MTGVSRIARAGGGRGIRQIWRTPDASWTASWELAPVRARISGRDPRGRVLGSWARRVRGIRPDLLNLGSAAGVGAS